MAAADSSGETNQPSPPNPRNTWAVNEIVKQTVSRLKSQNNFRREGGRSIWGSLKSASTYVDMNAAMLLVMFFGGILLWYLELRVNGGSLAKSAFYFDPSPFFFTLHLVFFLVLFLLSSNLELDALLKTIFLFALGNFVFYAQRYFSSLDSYGTLAYCIFAFLLLAFFIPKVAKGRIVTPFFLHVAMPFLGIIFLTLTTKMTVADPFLSKTLAIISLVFMGGLWPYWALFGLSSMKGTFANILKFVVAIIFIWGVFGAAIADMTDLESQWIDIKSLKDKAQDVDATLNPVQAAKNMVNWVIDIPMKTKKFYQRNMDYATGGDYYTGKVDENEQEPLGVYIKDLLPSDPKYDFSEPVTVWGLLYARTLDKEITVNLTCNQSKGRSAMPGRVTPDGEINITTLDEIDVSCRFDGNTFPLGTSQVGVNAEFTFTTMSYLRNYFMANHRIRSLRQEGVDPLDQYSITDKNPIAIFTNGPLYIGMETKTQPIGVDEGTEQVVEPRLGITLDNQWDGEVKKVTNLTVQVPLHTNLTDCDLNHPFNLSNSNESGNYYSLTQEGLDNIGTISDKHVTINCRIGVENAEKLLSGQPITTKFFKVSVDYVYVASESVSVEIVCTDSNSFECRSYSGHGGYSRTEYNFNPGDVKEPVASEKQMIEEKIIEPYWHFVVEHTPRSVPGCLIVGTIAQESSGDADADGGGGCTGLMQFCPSTAKQYGLCDNSDCSGRDDRNDPEQSIRAGGEYYENLIKMFPYEHKYSFAIASYYIGDSVIRSAIAKTGSSNPTWLQVFGKITPELMRSSSSTVYGPKSDSELNNIINTLSAHVPKIQGYTMYCEELMGTNDVVSYPDETEFRVQSVQTGHLHRWEASHLDESKNIIANLSYLDQDKSARYTMEILDKTYTMPSVGPDSYVWDRRYPFVRAKIRGFDNETADADFMIADAASKNLELTPYETDITPDIYNSTKEEVFKDWLYAIYDDKSDRNKLYLLDANSDVICTVVFSQSNPSQECGGVEWLKATWLSPDDSYRAKVNVAYNPD